MTISLDGDADITTCNLRPVYLNTLHMPIYEHRTNCDAPHLHLLKLSSFEFLCYRGDDAAALSTV